MNNNFNQNYKFLEDKISYKFNNLDYLKKALSHSSYVNEKNKKDKSNERLEFLGDSVLSLIVSETLYKEFPELPEGELTKVRAIVVCEQSLADCARNITLGDFLLLGKGEILSGGRNRSSILADAFEAIISAIFLDGGFEQARDFVLTNIYGKIKKAVDGDLYLDYKTKLQEVLQKNGNVSINYETIKESGPDHNKHFIIQVVVNGEPYGRGQGSSKKEAEQIAAKQALERSR